MCELRKKGPLNVPDSSLKNYSLFALWQHLNTKLLSFQFIISSVPMTPWKRNDPKVRLMEREATLNEICKHLSPGRVLGPASTDPRAKPQGPCCSLKSALKERCQALRQGVSSANSGLHHCFNSLPDCKQLSFPWACFTYGNWSQLHFYSLRKLKCQSFEELSDQNCSSVPNLEQCKKSDRGYRSLDLPGTGSLSDHFLEKLRLPLSNWVFEHLVPYVTWWE